VHEQDVVGWTSWPAARAGSVAIGCHRTRRYANNRIESDHRHVKRRLRATQGPRTASTACALITGIEAVQMIRKGQVLGITRKNLHGQAWVFGALLVSSNSLVEAALPFDRSRNAVATLPLKSYCRRF